MVTTKEPSASKSPERNPSDRDGKEFFPSGPSRVLKDPLGVEKLVVEYFLTKDGIALPTIPVGDPL